MQDKLAEIARIFKERGHSDVDSLRHALDFMEKIEPAKPLVPQASSIQPPPPPTPTALSASQEPQYHYRWTTQDYFVLRDAIIQDKSIREILKLLPHLKPKTVESYYCSAYKMWEDPNYTVTTGRIPSELVKIMEEARKGRVYSPVVIAKSNGRSNFHWRGNRELSLVATMIALTSPKTEISSATDALLNVMLMAGARCGNGTQIQKSAAKQRIYVLSKAAERVRAGQYNDRDPMQREVKAMLDNSALMDEAKAIYKRIRGIDWLR